MQFSEEMDYDNFNLLYILAPIVYYSIHCTVMLHNLCSITNEGGISAVGDQYRAGYPHRHLNMPRDQPNIVRFTVLRIIACCGRSLVRRLLCSPHAAGQGAPRGGAGPVLQMPGDIQ